MQPELDGKRFGMVPASRVGDFYLAYHRYLKENGVDGVKVRPVVHYVIPPCLQKHPHPCRRRQS